MNGEEAARIDHGLPQDHHLRGRKHFTREEQLGMISFIHYFERHTYTGGNRTFEVMATVKFFRRHNFQSWRNHWHKTVRPKLRELLENSPQFYDEFITKEVRQGSVVPHGESPVFEADENWIPDVILPEL